MPAISRFRLSLLPCLLALLASPGVVGGSRAQPVGDTRPPLDHSTEFIYFMPAYKTTNAKFEAAIVNAAQKLRDWLPTQLSDRTLRLNDPVFRICRGPSDEGFYSTDSYNRVFAAVQKCFPQLMYNDPLHRWVIYADVRHACDAPGRLGAGGWGVTIMPVQDLEGLAAYPDIYDDCGARDPFSGSQGVNRWIGGLGHELGHALGLDHPPGCDAGSADCDVNALMWAGYANFPSTYFRDAEKTFLLGSPFMGMWPHARRP